MRKGTSFGAPTEAESELADLVIAAVPSIEKVRLVSSGTEATMSAIRLARGYTGRPMIVKFAGNYHGHVDSLLVAAGSSAATLGVPNSPGVTEGIARDTLVLQYNDVAGLEAAFERHGAKIAGVIVEPVVGNMGCVVAKPEFLRALRNLTSQHGAVLIFDEVMTGFRVAFGGAQSRFGITPDLTTLGKIIGGGLPVGAYGGKAEIMDHILPAGKVFQAGTLERQSAGHGGGHRHAENSPRRESVSAARKTFRPAGRRLARRRRKRGRAASHRRVRLDAHVFLRRRRRSRLAHRLPLRHRPLRQIFLEPDRARHLHAVQPVRGPVPIDRPYRSGYRRNHCRCKVLNRTTAEALKCDSLSFMHSFITCNI